MIRKVAMCVTPWCAEFPDQEAQRVNCQFRMILKIILKKKSRERQASSRKQRLTMAQG
jgi:hypothetical protein